MIPPLQASKWLSIQALVSSREMGELLQKLGEFSIYLTIPCSEPRVSKACFLNVYEEYCKRLQAGEFPDPSYFRSYFSTFWTADPSAFSTVSVGENVLCRAVKPVIQLQYHLLGFSTLEKKFRPMVMGKGSMPWGIQFSYPTLFQDPHMQQVLKVGEGFPNTALFQSLRGWMRKATMPTPFMIEGKRMNIPIRIGKEARQWVNCHPQFSGFGISVEESA